MTRAGAVLALALLLCACTEFVNDTRAEVRGWCADNPDWCDMNAVK